MDKRWRSLATLALLVPALLQLFPLAYLISVSLKRESELNTFPPTLFPHALDFNHYRTALKTAPLGRFLFNSMLASLLITFFQVVTSLLAAYALSRLRFKGQGLALGLIVGTLLIPGEMTLIPNFLMLARWDWLDTYAALTVPFAASGFGVFLLYQFFRTVPKELEEAAILDGASRLRFLFQFLVPLSAPAILSFALYAFVNAWNQYLWPLVVTQTTAMQTAQIGIGMFRSQNESMSWGLIMAATAMLIAPPLLLFVATQKQFVRGITMSGLKG